MPPHKLHITQPPFLNQLPQLPRLPPHLLPGRVPGRPGTWPSLGGEGFGLHVALSTQPASAGAAAPAFILRRETGAWWAACWVDPKGLFFFWGMMGYDGVYGVIFGESGGVSKFLS